MLDKYWELVRNCDYCQRDHTLIQRYYQMLGYDMTISGQDGARWIACSENDLARVTATACPARYIGETGEHLTLNIIEDASSQGRFSIRASMTQ